MIQKLWYSSSILSWLLSPFALLFWLITSCRRWCYRVGLLKSFRADCLVIVVGNISVGGNGKTPVVIWLVERLKAAGYHPGVVSRGYGGKAPYYPYVLSDDSTPDLAGDEPTMIYQRCHCPVVVAPSRTDAVKKLREQHSVDVVICDDGLQHYALQRDIELVIVDGVRRFGNGFLLPMGPLRETASRVRSVFATIVNGSEAKRGEISMRLEPARIRRVSDHQMIALSPEIPVDAMAGIGYPPRFFRTLESLGYTLQQQVAFPDHHAFDATELKQRFGSHPLIMTEKDAVKCRSYALPNWYYLPVDAVLTAEFEQRLLTRLKELHHGT